MESEKQKPTLHHFTFNDPRVFLVTLLVVGTLGAWIWLSVALPFTVASPTTQPTTKATEAAHSDAQQYRRLNGLPLTQEGTESYPIGVMIENLPEVRPQAGLGNASVVYETLAEGGSTRFLALFSGAGDNLTKVGPVRSARPYYLEWNSEVDGLYAHAGGSPEALQMISAFSVKVLNGIGREAKYFWRDKGIGAPHNLFTSSELLTRALRDLSLDSKAPTFSSWEFKDDPVLAERPAAETTLRIKFSGFAFETEYRYRQQTNTFARFNSGVAHTDANTGEHIQANNVIVQVIPSILAVGEKGRLTLDVTGTGKAWIAIDGRVREGTWLKKDRTSRTEWFEADGTPVQFNRGSTWIAVVPQDQPVESETK